MGALVFPGRIGIMDEPLLIDGLQDIDQCVMNDTILEGCYRYDPFFRFMNGEIPILSRSMPPDG